MKKITILILDEHLLFREALAKVLNNDNRLEVISVTGSFKEVLDICSVNQPDVLLLGTHMSPVDGFTIAEMIKIAYTDISIIGLSAYAAPLLVKKFLQLGGLGYVTRSASCDELIASVLAVKNGQIYLSQDIKNVLSMEQITPSIENKGWSSLTKREMLILQGVKNGKTSKALAHELGLSAKTIEAHRYNILRKLKLKNTVALVQYANRQGI